MEQQTNTAPEQNAEEVKSPKKKKRFGRLLLLLAVIVIVWWYNNFTIKTPEYTVVSPKIKSDIKIAVMSDYHAADYGIDNEQIMAKLREIDPDIVFMLGDMYSRKSEWELVEIPIKLAESIMQEGYRLYFVPGEHDTSQEYLDAISDTGAHVMDYMGEKIEVNGTNLQIMGIDNVYYSDTFDLTNVFTPDPYSFSILMAHIPNYEKFADFGADLTLCGDSHGGIIQLPFGRGPAYYSETGTWFPELFEEKSDVYDKGFFSYEGGVMFITSGLGSYPVPARLNNRPEIAVITLTSDE
ncbi:MAG: metallophosphoesterase [Ruminococcus sp.]|nr:metallophosphoesterase [Ruminococcus sp.]